MDTAPTKEKRGTPAQYKRRPELPLIAIEVYGEIATLPGFYSCVETLSRKVIHLDRNEIVWPKQT